MPRLHAKLRMIAAGLAAVAALGPGAAVAETWEIVVPPNLPRSDELKAAIWDFFLHDLAPGDSLTLYDGLHGHELLRIAIPNEARFSNERIRTKAFARETARLSRALDALKAEGNPDSPYRIRFPEFVYGYAHARTSAESQLLVITSGMNQSDLEPSFSFRLVGGKLYLPTDAHIAAPLSASPYGTQGRETELSGVAAHFCLLSQDDRLTTYQKDELRRFWSLYVTWLGGDFATFTESLPGCFDRWRHKTTGGLPKEKLDISSDVLAMRSVARTPLEDAAPDAAVPEGVETFTLFNSKPHPGLPGVEVTTGVQYRADEYPRSYGQAWCYAMIEHHGASIRVEIGTKTPYRKIDWSAIPQGTLDAAGISREQAEAGRSACQFPGDAT